MPDPCRGPEVVNPAARARSPLSGAARAEVLESLLTSRWSCRAFASREVPMTAIEHMFAMAQRAPSWCNTQPWAVEVTVGAETERFRQALLQHVASDAGSEPDFEMPSSYDGRYRDRRRASGWQLYDAVGIERGDREASARQAARNFDLFGAPHVAIVSAVRSQGAYGALDVGIYVGALLLAAESLGLGAIPQAALARFSPFIRGYFGLEQDRGILLAVSFGYPDLTHPVNAYRTERASLDEAVVFHRKAT